ncbi:hypothetical protein F5887DRAFT_1154986 [Amanita rubescens]|nr:hypothetical protein F5887DRAFT_1154986 [Amanita rubescens]
MFGGSAHPITTTVSEGDQDEIVLKYTYLSHIFPAGDAGGEPLACTPIGNPVGGLAFSTAFGQLEQTPEWTHPLGANASTTLQSATGTCPPTTVLVAYSSNASATVACALLRVSNALSTLIRVPIKPVVNGRVWQLNVETRRR